MVLKNTLLLYKCKRYSPSWTCSHSVAQVGLGLSTGFLFQPPECWNYRRERLRPDHSLSLDSHCHFFYREQTPLFVQPGLVYRDPTVNLSLCWIWRLSGKSGWFPYK